MLPRPSFKKWPASVATGGHGADRERVRRPRGLPYGRGRDCRRPNDRKHPPYPSITAEMCRPSQRTPCFWRGSRRRVHPRNLGRLSEMRMADATNFPQTPPGVSPSIERAPECPPCARLCSPMIAESWCPHASTCWTTLMTHTMPVYVPAADDVVLVLVNTSYARGTRLYPCRPCGPNPLHSNPPTMRRPPPSSRR